MHLILNYYLFILFFSTTLSIKENIEKPLKIAKTIKENTSLVSNSLPNIPKTRKALKLKHEPSDPSEPSEFPVSTEVDWRNAILTDVSKDELNPNGFVNVACYVELTKVETNKLYNKTFRFDVEKILEGKNCLLRFPVGMYLQYRFKFANPNTYVFFALGNSANITVATSRVISSTEPYDRHFNWWKGIIFVPCRFATLVFRPFTTGEIFEFKFLNIPPKIVDKCSNLEYEYYRSTKHL